MGDLLTRVATVESATILADPRWAPDGARFTFMATAPEGATIMLGNASGGRIAPLDLGAGSTSGAVWSPDGEWVVFRRLLLTASESQAVRIRPGSTTPPEVLATYDELEPGSIRFPIAWSPSGEFILASTGRFDRSDLYLMSPDFQTERRLSSRQFERVPVTFSADGRQVLGMFHNTTGEDAEWQLYAIDVASGAEELLAAVDLPPDTGEVDGFSLHPDGTRFVTSISKWPYDIWMLEGFE